MRLNVHKSAFFFLGPLFFLILIIRYGQGFIEKIGHLGGICISIVSVLSPFFSRLPFLLSFSLIFHVAIRVLFVLVKTRYVKKRLIVVDNSYHVNTLARKYNLDGKIHTIAHPKPIAFCLGLRDPRIYISNALTGIMTPKELEAVILHEKYHLDHNDSLFHAVAMSFSHLCSLFLPLIPDIISVFLTKKEIEADSYGVKIMRSDAYIISAFQKLIVHSNTIALDYVVSFFSHRALEERIRALRGERKKPFLFSISIRRTLFTFCSLLFFLTVFFTPPQPSQAKSSNDNTTICVKGHSCHDCG